MVHLSSNISFLYIRGIKLASLKKEEDDNKSLDDLQKKHFIHYIPLWKEFLRRA